MIQNLEVEVKGINYTNNQYTIFSFKLREKFETPTLNLVAFGDVGLIFKGDILKISGEWVNNKLYGMQFKIDKATRKEDISTDAIKEFLINIGKEEKIGKRTIEKIINIYGKDSIEIIKNKPEELPKLRISAKKVDKLRKLLIRNEEMVKVFEYFKEIGVSKENLLEMYNKYGIESIKRARLNPYSMYKTLSFQEMEHIAEHHNLPYNSENRIKAAIINLMIENMSYTGELFFDLNTGNIEDLVRSFIIRKGYYKNSPELTKKEIFKVLQDLADNRELELPLSYDMSSLFIKKYWYLQTDIADMIEKHIREESYTNGYSKLANEDVGQYLKSSEIVYNEGQLNAIRDALNYKISLLVGGPGTGKTQTIKGIMEAFKNRHIESQKEYKLANKTVIQPCGPTGRAAQRIMDLTGKEAKTIHRLLGIRGANVKEHELETVYADLVIIDEASMMDCQLFYYLMSALKSYTHLVIVGDIDQLPSIGKGFILRDLIGVGEWKVKIIGYNKLTKVYRQLENNPIIKNAYSILNHEKGQVLNMEVGKGFKIVERNNQEEIKKALLYEIEKHIDSGQSFDELQILTPMNNGELGTFELNEAIQQRFNKQENTTLKVGKNKILKPGDKVMQTNNNYDLEVFNGEVGRILSIAEGPKLTVDYGYKKIEYTGEVINELVLAYVITVHKSQGSEYRKVIMPVDKGHLYMLDKNLLYTAITRAKEEMVIIGDEETIQIAAEKKRIVTSIRNILDSIMKVKNGLK